jgi:hypothetical protein
VQVFGHDLGTLAECLDIEPLGVFLRLAGTVLSAFGTGDGEGGDGCATDGVLHIPGLCPDIRSAESSAWSWSPVNLKLRSGAK